MNILSVLSFIGVSYLLIDKYLKYRKKEYLKRIYKDTYIKEYSDDEYKFDISDLQENGLLTVNQEKSLSYRGAALKPRRGKEETFIKRNIILRDGEMIVAYRKDGSVGIKIGNGIDAFTDLPYVSF